VRIGFLSEMINKELSFLIPRAMVFDGVLYAFFLPFYEFGLEIPAGLLLGTFAMLVNFVLLGISCERALMRSGRLARRYMMSRYVGRMVILGVFIFIAIKVTWINLLATVLPLFYPKLAYTIHGAYTARRNVKSASASASRVMTKPIAQEKVGREEI
jgi:hypothetical protein